MVMDVGSRGRRYAWCGKSLAASSHGYPAQVSVRRDFMIAKDPRAITLKTLRQKQMFRDYGSTAGIIRMLNPEYQDFIPGRLGPAGTEAGPEPWKF